VLIADTAEIYAVVDYQIITVNFSQKIKKNEIPHGSMISSSRVGKNFPQPPTSTQASRKFLVERADSQT
jgi:hypothetical protein